MRRSCRVVLRLPLFAVVLSAVACAHPVPATPGLPVSFERSIRLNGSDLTLHVAPGANIRRNQLLLYATGDGGWRGKDRDLFEHLESWGYCAVGFSAPDYLKHLPGDDGTTTPARLASDFAQIIDASRSALQLPASVSVVLVGVSRGADLVVVAAGQPGLQPQLAGVVAMALTREEEYVRRRRAPQVALELYTYLPNLGDVPVSVIQSTRDNYLPADEARELFGGDTAVRKFHAIDARNHSFAGARDLLYDTLRSSLAWVEHLGRRARA